MQEIHSTEGPTGLSGPPPEIGTHRAPHRSLPPLQLTASDVWRRDGGREGDRRRGGGGDRREREGTGSFINKVRHRHACASAHTHSLQVTQMLFHMFTSCAFQHFLSAATFPIRICVSDYEVKSTCS